jgi:hypothetical protein
VTAFYRHFDFFPFDVAPVFVFDNAVGGSTDSTSDENR